MRKCIVQAYFDVGSNHMFMAGGEFPDGSASKSMWRYDPCIDKWQETSPMNMPRSELGQCGIVTSRSVAREHAPIRTRPV